MKKKYEILKKVRFAHSKKIKNLSLYEKIIVEMDSVKIKITRIANYLLFQIDKTTFWKQA